MSTGPIVKALPRSSGGRQFAGVLLLSQAALRGFFIVNFLLALSRHPPLSHAVLGNAYPLVQLIVLPAFFLVAGAVIGLLLLARVRVAAELAVVFCVLGLLFQAFSAYGIWFAYSHVAHSPPTQTFVLMALSVAIYLGVLVAVVRSA